MVTSLAQADGRPIAADPLFLSSREPAAFCADSGVPPAEHTPLSQHLRRGTATGVAHLVIEDSLASHSATRSHAAPAAAAWLPPAPPLASPPTEPLTLRLSAPTASPPKRRPPPTAPSAPSYAAPASLEPPISAHPVTADPPNATAPAACATSTPASDAPISACPAAAAPPSATPRAPCDASTPGSTLRLGQSPRLGTASGGAPPSPTPSEAPSSVSPAAASAVSQTPRPRNLDAYLPTQICEAYYGSKGPWPELYEWQVRFA